MTSAHDVAWYCHPDGKSMITRATHMSTSISPNTNQPINHSPTAKNRDNPSSAHKPNTIQPSNEMTRTRRHRMNSRSRPLGRQATSAVPQRTKWTIRRTLNTRIHLIFQYIISPFPFKRIMFHPISSHPIATTAPFSHTDRQTRRNQLVHLFAYQ